MNVVHYDGFIILLIVLMGLVPICRGGKWNWLVVSRSKTLSIVFWYGWSSALIVGVLRLFGVGNST